MLGSVTVLLSFLTACSHVNENYEKTYPELITHFANCGIKVDSVTPLAYYLAQAESGYAFKIGPREIRNGKNRITATASSRIPVCCISMEKNSRLC